MEYDIGWLYDSYAYILLNITFIENLNKLSHSNL